MVLKFAGNWNKKLDCKYFTSFRLHNKSKYAEGVMFDILIKDQGHYTWIFNAVIVELRTFKLSQVNNFITTLDAGYEVDDFIKMVKTMYKNIVKDFDTQLWDFILLKKIDNYEKDKRTN